MTENEKLHRKNFRSKINDKIFVKDLFEKLGLNHKSLITVCAQNKFELSNKTDTLNKLFVYSEFEYATYFTLKNFCGIFFVLLYLCPKIQSPDFGCLVGYFNIMGETAGLVTLSPIINLIDRNKYLEEKNENSK